jgi:hypothetical protein
VARGRTTFRETMAGTIKLAEQAEPVPLRMRLQVDLPGILLPGSDVVAGLTGEVTATGLAEDPAATGTMRIAPIHARVIHYRCDFTALDGRRLHLDGHKSIDFAHPVRSMTTLPATVRDDKGVTVGEADLLFDARRDLGRFLASFRYRTESPLWPARWRGQPGRLEVWYTTLTDPDTGTGVWLHHEVVAPTDGSAAHALGWAAVFRPGMAPIHGRFGPVPHQKPADGDVFTAGEVSVAPDRLRGIAGDIQWDLQSESSADPLFTFPQWAWNRELLPAAHVVAAPAATFGGTIKWSDGEVVLKQGHGATARIYGHGNAQRWAWLHADLGDRDVLEIVSAQSRRWPLRAMPPSTFLRLRVGGREWPQGDGLVLSPRFRSQIGLPSWSVSGRVGNWRIQVDVTQPPDATLALEYRDPDGAKATCHNSERADVKVVLEERRGSRWRVHRTWELNGTAHAEVGVRE